jgi:hypothetical protein
MQALLGCSKGVVVNIRQSMAVYSMVTSTNSATQVEALGGDTFSSSPSSTPKSDVLVIGFADGYNALVPEVSSAPLPALEKPKEPVDHTLGRDDNRIRSPRLAASGRWNKVGKGSRQIRFVTLGQRLALRVECRESCLICYP